MRMYGIKFLKKKDTQNLEIFAHKDKIFKNFVHVWDKIFQKNKDPKNLERQVGDKIFAHV